MAASPLPSWGSKRGLNCYVTPAFLGVPNAKHGRKSEVAAPPLPSRGPKRGRNCYVTPAFSGVPNAKLVISVRGWKAENQLISVLFIFVLAFFTV